jgi:ribonuclease-3
LSDIPGELLNRVNRLEDAIGYRYHNKKHALNALIHSSYANESHRNLNLGSNERLEFLGDAVLDFVMGMMLYNNHPEMSEGEMSKIRALIVCEASLAECAQTVGLGDLILLGRGEETSGGRKRPSILSDCLEAVIGSIYLDGGMDEAEGFIMGLLGDIYQRAVGGTLFMDYKTMLQEELQKNGDARIQYKLIESLGPDHAKLFRISVLSGDTVLGTGSGKSKKEAEQEAAKSALEALGLGKGKG